MGTLQVQTDLTKEVGGQEPGIRSTNKLSGTSWRLREKPIVPTELGSDWITE